MFSLSKILKEIKFILNPLLMETNKELITNLEHINEDMKLTTTYWMLF